MCGLEIPSDSNVLIGLSIADDAGVYKISDDLALIQTVDFFTPIVDDPFRFGEIAAANALSDVYAMGGVPKTAMNLVAYPIRSMDISVLRQILQGGIAKLKEAEVSLIGGHSIEDKELKYGMAVSGFVHPDKILTKKNIHPKDLLILTKPIGTGIINTAMKAGKASESLIESTNQMMAELNRTASEIMAKYKVHACTDITGFGLLGHLSEMVEHSGCSIRLMTNQIPIIPEAYEFAVQGVIPGGTRKNLEFRESMVKFSDSVPNVMVHVLFDPQTSGGLLMSIDPDCAQTLLEDLHDHGVHQSAIIGEVVKDGSEKIVVD